MEVASLFFLLEQSQSRDWYSGHLISNVDRGTINLAFGKVLYVRPLVVRQLYDLEATRVSRCMNNVTNFYGVHWDLPLSFLVRPLL